MGACGCAEAEAGDVSMLPKSGLMSFTPDSVSKGSVLLTEDYLVISGTSVPGGAMVGMKVSGKQVFKF